MSAAEPLAYWSFDAGLEDLTGNGHDAASRGGATTSSDVPADIGRGRSMRFDGSDDYVSAEIDVSETQYSSSFWFKTTASNAGMFTIVETDLGGAHDRHVYLSSRNTRDARLEQRDDRFNW